MDRRWMSTLLALALASSVTAGCGGDDSTTATSSATTAAKSGGGSTTGPTAPQVSSGEKNDRGESVSGQLQIGGKWTGTFAWNKDLAVSYCSDVRVDFTMTDGKGNYISISSAKLNDGTDKSQVGSGTLPGGPFTGKSAQLDAKATANQAGANGTVSWANVDFKSRTGDSVTVNGKLTFACPG